MDESLISIYYTIRHRQMPDEISATPPGPLIGSLLGSPRQRQQPLVRKDLLLLLRQKFIRNLPHTPPVGLDVYPCLVPWVYYGSHIRPRVRYGKKILVLGYPGFIVRVFVYLQQWKILLQMFQQKTARQMLRSSSVILNVYFQPGIVFKKNFGLLYFPYGGECMALPRPFTYQWHTTKVIQIKEGISNATAGISRLIAALTKTGTPAS